MSIATVIFNGLRNLRKNLRAGALIALLRLPREAFSVSPEQLILLVLVDLVVSLLAGISYSGLDGYLNYYALPGALYYLPLLLLFGFLVARAGRHPSMALILPIAFVSAGIITNLLYAIAWLALKQIETKTYYSTISMILYYGYYVWWALIAGVFLKRFLGFRLPKLLLYNLLFILSNLLPIFMLPHNDLWVANANDAYSRRTFSAIAREEIFHAQPALLDAAIENLAPQRDGISDLYFVGFGADASEDVFMKEIRVVEDLFSQRFDTDQRAVMLINNSQTAGNTPIATATNLRKTLHRVGQLINPDEDLVMLYLTSHGSSKHELAVSFWPLQLHTITPVSLKTMLNEAGIKWRVIVVSACYSGGYVEPLKDDHTLIMTASDATHTSFGCGNESDFTYFGKALFDEELRKTFSFTQAFKQAKASILKREQAEGFEPSNPQIFVGKTMPEKLLELEARLAHNPSAQTAGVPLYEK
jgi:Peptidase C13 family